MRRTSGRTARIPNRPAVITNTSATPAISTAPTKMRVRKAESLIEIPAQSDTRGPTPS